MSGMRKLSRLINSEETMVSRGKCARERERKNIACTHYIDNLMVKSTSLLKLYENSSWKG